MIREDVLIIGAGQAGLAMSACLTARGIGNVLIERGRVAERWRSERWDSLRLLTPSWMTRLPGLRQSGGDPGGFLARDELVALLERYGAGIGARVEAGTRLLRLEACSGGFAAATDRGGWRGRAVVLATGACDVAQVPAWAGALAGRVRQVVSAAYRRAADLPQGGVLVVGASATGVQLAEEIHGSGRSVTLAVGRHTRLPRRYRGRDIMAWMDAAGMLDERADAVPDLAAARRQPSLQLAGRSDGEPDLPRLAALGVEIVGRALDGRGERVTLAPDLADEVAAAERRRRRVLARIDSHVAAAGLAAPADPAAWAAPVLPGCTRTALDLRASGIATVVWATGFRRDYSWLGVPVLDPAGELIHDGGVLPVPGLYALGLRFQRRRSSTFIDGVGRDAEEIAAEIAVHLGRRPARAA